MARIVVLGDVNADLTWTLPVYPAEGDDCTAAALHWGSGGAGLNVALAYCRLGAEVQLVARVGSDPAAALALAPALAVGMDLTTLQRTADQATGLCSVAVGPGGQRTFFSFRGANVGLDPASLPPDLLTGAALLQLSSHALLEGPQRLAALALNQQARALGVPVALDLGLPAVRRCPELIDQLLPGLWLLTLNEDELTALAPGSALEQTLQGLLARGVCRVALKRGAAGCLALAPGRRVALAPPPVTACDTNGCGDAFAAGFAWGLLHDGDLDTAATLGNLLGALTATRPGAADALPTTAELQARLPVGLLARLAPRDGATGPETTAGPTPVGGAQ